MFQNRLHGIVPNLGNLPVNAAFLAAASGDRVPAGLPAPVQISDIYQAAKNRAVEDHEIDKLFNPEHYDFQI